MKNKSTCSPIFSKEQKIALLDGFQKQNTYTTLESYAKANNVKESTLRGWSVRYRRCPVGWHHSGLILSKEQKLALLDGFQKQNTHTTIGSYAKANNVSRPALCKWSRIYGIPLENHHGNQLPKEQKIALLEGFQKQNIYTTIESYAKANNLRKGALGSWSRIYGIPLGWHHGNHINQLPKEQKIALLEGFQKQNTHTTSAEYAKANNVKKGTLYRWAEVYGIPLGWHHTKRIKKKPTQENPLLEALRNQHRISQ